jgi:hypothetical protein
MRQGKDYANLLALYTFYTYHAKQQKTNQPLATDEFTRRGMNWAIDRVKKIKRILKEMKLVEVIQKGQYSYIKLPYIYTQKRVGEILGKIVNQVSEIKPKILKAKESIKEAITTPKKVIKEEESPILKQWIEYCKNSGIKYNKNNIKHWEDKVKNRVTVDQQIGIYKAINSGWKNFYITPLKESKVHKLLGKSLMMERDCDTLLDITYREKKYVYQFKNIRVVSIEVPTKLFAKYGYSKTEVKTAPIVADIKDKILSVVKTDIHHTYKLKVI